MQVDGRPYRPPVFFPIAVRRRRPCITAAMKPRRAS